MTVIGGVFELGCGIGGSAYIGRGQLNPRKKRLVSDVNQRERDSRASRRGDGEAQGRCLVGRAGGCEDIVVRLNCCPLKENVEKASTDVAVVGVLEVETNGVSAVGNGNLIAELPTARHGEGLINRLRSGVDNSADVNRIAGGTRIAGSLVGVGQPIPNGVASRVDQGDGAVEGQSTGLPLEIDDLALCIFFKPFVGRDNLYGGCGAGRGLWCVAIETEVDSAAAGARFVEEWGVGIAGVDGVGCRLEMEIVVAASVADQSLHQDGVSDFTLIVVID